MSYSLSAQGTSGTAILLVPALLEKPLPRNRRNSRRFSGPHSPKKLLEWRPITERRKVIRKGCANYLESQAALRANILLEDAACDPAGKHDRQSAIFYRPSQENAVTGSMKSREKW